MRYTIILLMLLVVSCAEQPSKELNVRPVKVTVAKRAEYIEKDFAGMATPDEAVNLAFKVSGQILHKPVSSGDMVSRDELLAELDPRDFELRENADRSSLEQAKSKLDRMERLIKHEAVSRQEYESAKALYAQAKATYENSKELLAQTKIYAPFKAVVEKSYAEEYERVQAGQTIFKVVNPQTTTVEFTLPESSLHIIQNPTTKFRVEFDNYKGVIFNAVLDSYARTTSDASGFPVALTLNAGEALKYNISPGLSCTITVISEDNNKGAILLPLSAIYAPTQGGNYVWVVDSNDRVQRHVVTLGSLYGANYIIVNDGVESGDRVVTAGVYQLQQGDKIKIE